MPQPVNMRRAFHGMTPAGPLKQGPSEPISMFYRLSPELVIRSPWRLFWPRRGEHAVVLAGNGVFPASHATTHLCLDLLKSLLASRPGLSILDVGCGSGILANLPWGVHLEKVDEFCRLAGPRGSLTISGFKDTQVEPLLAAYQGKGWTVKEHRSRDSWAPEPPPELSYTWVAWLLGRGADG
jgi:hypothetical protein